MCLESSRLVARAAEPRTELREQAQPRWPHRQPRPRRLRCAPCVWPPSCAGCCGWDGRTLCSERGRKCCRGAHASSRALPPRPPAGPERGAAEAQETDRQTDGRRESGEEGGAGRCCRCERLLRVCGDDAGLRDDLAWWQVSDACSLEP